MTDTPIIQYRANPFMLESERETAIKTAKDVIDKIELEGTLNQDQLDDYEEAIIDYNYYREDLDGYQEYQSVFKRLVVVAYKYFQEGSCG